MKRILLTVLSVIFLLLMSKETIAQARLVLNGGVINITDGAVLVIDNPDKMGITYNGSGYIQSEGADNKVIWFVGEGEGARYTIPFGNSSDYLPVSFNASAGSADGYFIFSTYPTSTWKNSDDLPPGVTNINASGADNSAKVIDRFWQVSPQGYTTKPDLSNLTFNYSDAEYSSPNTITEVNLLAQSWNNGSKIWSGFVPSSILNAVNNTVKIPTVPGFQLYDWFTLVDANAPLPVTLIDFKVTSINNIVTAYWNTSFEKNTSRFEVYRSKDGEHFELTGQVAASVNSNTVLTYEFTDKDPFLGASFYRLKIIDLDGNYVWSNIEKIIINFTNKMSVYPNPAQDHLVLQTNNDFASKSPIVFIYDAKGRLVYSLKVTGASQEINIVKLPKGIYQLIFRINKEQHKMSFIKN